MDYSESKTKYIYIKDMHKKGFKKKQQKQALIASRISK